MSGQVYLTTSLSPRLCIITLYWPSDPYWPKQKMNSSMTHMTFCVRSAEYVYVYICMICLNMMIALTEMYLYTF